MADANRRNKYYLSINEEKNVFKCWYCQESGGVLRFISLLEGKSEQELLKEILKQRGSKHPAEWLTRRQLSLIGYPKIDWAKERQTNYSRYKALREEVINKWRAYVRNKKRYCYQLLFIGLVAGNLKESIEEVKEIEKELSEKFLNVLLECLFQESKSSQLFQLECLTCELTNSRHPYETFLIEDNTPNEAETDETIKNEDEEGEEFQMLNVCTFVGRLASEVDMRYTPNGNPVANFSLALTRAVPDQNGERKADFIRCQAWGKVAENIANQLSKGDVIGVQTRVQTRSYQNQQGQNVYVTEFIIEGLPTFIKVKKWENSNKKANTNNSGNYQQQGQVGQPNSDNYGFEGYPYTINDNDLPF